MTFLMRESLSQKISMARFANVAFSDGSLIGLMLGFQSDSQSRAKGCSPLFFNTSGIWRALFVIWLLAKTEIYFFLSWMINCISSLFRKLLISFCGRRGMNLMSAKVKRRQRQG